MPEKHDIVIASIKDRADRYALSQAKDSYEEHLKQERARDPHSFLDGVVKRWQMFRLATPFKEIIVSSRRNDLLKAQRLTNFTFLTYPEARDALKEAKRAVKKDVSKAAIETARETAKNAVAAAGGTVEDAIKAGKKAEKEAKKQVKQAAAATKVEGVRSGQEEQASVETVGKFRDRIAQAPPDISERYGERMMRVITASPLGQMVITELVNPIVNNEAGFTTPHQLRERLVEFVKKKSLANPDLTPEEQTELKHVFNPSTHSFGGKADRFATDLLQVGGKIRSLHNAGHAVEECIDNIYFARERAAVSIDTRTRIEKLSDLARNNQIAVKIGSATLSVGLNPVILAIGATFALRTLPGISKRFAGVVPFIGGAGVGAIAAGELQRRDSWEQYRRVLEQRGRGAADSTASAATPPSPNRLKRLLKKLGHTEQDRHEFEELHTDEVWAHTLLTGERISPPAGTSGAEFLITHIGPVGRETEPGTAEERKSIRELIEQLGNIEAVNMADKETILRAASRRMAEIHARLNFAADFDTVPIRYLSEESKPGEKRQLEKAVDELKRAAQLVFNHHAVGLPPAIAIYTQFVEMTRAYENALYDRENKQGNLFTDYKLKTQQAKRHITKYVIETQIRAFVTGIGVGLLAKVALDSPGFIKAVIGEAREHSPWSQLKDNTIVDKLIKVFEETKRPRDTHTFNITDNVRIKETNPGVDISWDNDNTVVTDPDFRVINDVLDSKDKSVISTTKGWFFRDRDGRFIATDRSLMPSQLLQELHGWTEQESLDLSYNFHRQLAAFIQAHEHTQTQFGRFVFDIHQDAQGHDMLTFKHLNLLTNQLTGESLDVVVNSDLSVTIPRGHPFIEALLKDGWTQAGESEQGIRLIPPQATEWIPPTHSFLAKMRGLDTPLIPIPLTNTRRILNQSPKYAETKNIIAPAYFDTRRESGRLGGEFPKTARLEDIIVRDGTLPPPGYRLRPNRIEGDMALREIRETLEGCKSINVILPDTEGDAKRCAAYVHAIIRWNTTLPTPKFINIFYKHDVGGGTGFTHPARAILETTFGAGNTPVDGIDSILTLALEELKNIIEANHATGDMLILDFSEGTPNINPNVSQDTLAPLPPLVGDARRRTIIKNLRAAEPLYSRYGPENQGARYAFLIEDLFSLETNISPADATPLP